MVNYGAALPLLSSRAGVECHLLQFDFTSGVQRYNTSLWDLDWDGVNWPAGKGLFSIDYAAQSLEIEVYGAKVRLSAMNPSMLSRALSEKVKGKTAAIYHAVLNPDTFEIEMVVREFRGYMSAISITSGGSSAG